MKNIKIRLKNIIIYLKNALFKAKLNINANKFSSKKFSTLIPKIMPKIKKWFLRFIQIQLVMTIVSLLVLVNWGLPISLLSPIGNMLFSPICTAFLALSSIIFFLEIFYIPNAFFIYLLEKVTNFWLFLAQDFGNKSLMAFTQPSVLFTIIIAILTILILIHKKINSLNKSIFALSTLLLLSCIYLKIGQTNKTFIKHIKINKDNNYNTGYVTFIYKKGKTTILDTGAMGRRISAENFVNYTLVPEIIKSSGVTTIDNIIILKPGKLTFDAVIQLCKSFVVKNINMRPIQGKKFKKGLKRSFFKLEKTCKNNGTKLNWFTLSLNFVKIISKIPKNF